MINMSTSRRMSNGGIGPTSSQRNSHAETYAREEDKRREREAYNRIVEKRWADEKDECRGYSADQLALNKNKCDRYGITAPRSVSSPGEETGQKNPQKKRFWQFSSSNVGGTAKRKTAKRKTAKRKTAKNKTPAHTAAHKAASAAKSAAKSASAAASKAARAAKSASASKAASAAKSASAAASKAARAAKSAAAHAAKSAAAHAAASASASAA